MSVLFQSTHFLCPSIMKNSFLLVLLYVCFACQNSVTPTLEHKIRGKKNPTVILENGMASTFETWKQIPDSLSKYATVLTYNRAGLGKSEIAESKRTVPNMVKDLEQLLEQKKLNGPFILVAHSMGSYVSRYYALQHPKKVLGILLIDPSPDKMYDAYTEKEMSDFLKFGNENFKNSSDPVKKEWQNYLDNRKFVQHRISDSIPITVLSATQWDFFKYHSSILNSNPKTKHLKVIGSHDLHHEKPQLIIKMIKELINN